MALLLRKMMPASQVPCGPTLPIASFHTATSKPQPHPHPVNYSTLHSPPGSTSQLLLAAFLHEHITCPSTSFRHPLSASLTAEGKVLVSPIPWREFGVLNLYLERKHLNFSLNLTAVYHCCYKSTAQNKNRSVILWLCCSRNLHNNFITSQSL